MAAASKMKGGKKKNPQLYSHIASAIIPSAGIVAVPSAARTFPRQKTRANEQWGPLAPTLLRAASTSQLLIPSSSLITTHEGHDDQHARQRRSTGRMDASSNEDESDDERGVRRKSLPSPVDKRSSSTGAIPLADNDGDMSYRNPAEALAAELSRSTSAAAPYPVKSPSGPTIARAAGGEDARSLVASTGRSSLNETTTIPLSARSVSFKEPVVNEVYDPPSSHSHQTSTVVAANRNPALDQQNMHELEQRTQLINDEVQQLRLHNSNLQKQQDALLDRLQSSQKLSHQELNDLLQQSGYEQTKDLQVLNRTLQSRCDQLQNELITMRDRYTQSQNQSSVRELKNENHFLKEYIHRLNATSSEYQALHPPKALKKDQRKMQGLPMKGPSPIWLLNQKFLAPLFVCYDEKLLDREEFIKKLQTQLHELHDQVTTITDENIALHDRLSRSSASTSHGAPLSDLDHIKRQAYLVLEENKVLQDQLSLQTNRLTDVQKTQIHEVSTLTRRLMIVESEKTEADRILDTIRMKNEDLRRKYDQLMMDNNHRIHVQEHVHEIGEMKRLTDELSEKHAHEMELLLRRVQDSEAAKKVAQLKLTEYRSDIERLKGENKATKRLNKKFQLRVQTFEKKLELQQVKEQRMGTMLEKTHEECEQTKLERDTYLTLAKTKEDEMNKTRAQMTDEADKLAELEERLESYKSRSKERTNEVQEQMKQQYDNVKLRCLEHEQRIQQLVTLLNEKQILIDDLNHEKRHLQVDLESIWQATNADNIRMREQLIDMRVAS